MNKFIEKARKQRENILKSSASLNDQDASVTPELFAKLEYKGELVKVGTRINWNGTIKKAVVDVWDEEMYNPDNAPTLWEDISYKDGIRIIPSIITAASAFGLHERGWWNGILYESLMPANVHNPEQYPLGWAIANKEAGI